MSDDDGGSDILSEDAPFDDEDENDPATQLPPQQVIQELTTCISQIEHSTTWTAFASYLAPCLETQRTSREALTAAVMLGGAPVAQRTNNHPEPARQKSVWQFAFFMCIVRIVRGSSNNLGVSVSDPLYRPADSAVFAHFGVQVIQQTANNLRTTFLYMPFLPVGVRQLNLAKGPGIVFTDLGPTDVQQDPLIQQWMNALPLAHWYQASNLLGGFTPVGTFLNHTLLA